MKQHRIVAVIASIIALLAMACSGGAPSAAPPPKAASVDSKRPTTVEEIATYKSPDRRQILEEGAKKEGKITLYTSGIIPQTTRPMLDAFEAKYPYIKVDAFRANAPEIVQKAAEEYKAGRYEVDVFETIPAGLVEPKRLGLLTPIYSPDLDKYPQDVKDKEGYYVGVRESYLGLGFNTNVLSLAEVPKNLRDLANPRWKGQMMLAGGTASPSWIGAVLATEGEDFLRRLSQQQDMRYNSGTPRTVADLIIAGEVPLSPTIFDSHVAVSKAEGAPIEWLPIEPVVTNLGSIALAKRAPHPHASMLLIDFWISEDGQKVLMARNYSSPRIDVGGRKEYKKYYPENVPNFTTEFEKWQRLLRDLFIRGGGA